MTLSNGNELYYIFYFVIVDLNFVMTIRKEVAKSVLVLYSISLIVLEDESLFYW